MRRRHTTSPGFSGHYQDLGISNLKSHDTACNFILSVGYCTGKTPDFERATQTNALRNNG